jgi:hypothetical protein
VLARLAGQERVQAGRGGLVQAVGGGAGDDADAADRVRAVAEEQRLAAGGLLHARVELGLGDPGERAGAADEGALVVAERPRVGAAERLGSAARCCQ